MKIIIQVKSNKFKIGFIKSPNHDDVFINYKNEVRKHSDNNILGIDNKFSLLLTKQQTVYITMNSDNYDSVINIPLSKSLYDQLQAYIQRGSMESVDILEEGESDPGNNWIRNNPQEMIGGKRKTRKIRKRR